MLNSGSGQMLLALAGFMICFSVCQACYSVFQNLLNARLNTKQNVAVQAAVMNRIMSLPVTFFRRYSAGELQRRADYVQELASLLLSTIGTTGLTSAFSLIYLGQIFAFAPTLVVPSLCITLATLAVALMTAFLQLKVSRERMEIAAKTSGLTYSIITGIQKIKLAGA
ncbi:MAG: ABC transporter transmembrane domain-containing protein [Ruminiclostridium sp.]